MTIGLRISKLDPAPAPSKKVITEDKVQAIVDWAKKNGLTIDQVAAKYDFASDTVRDAIADALVPAAPTQEEPKDDLPE